MYDDKAIYSVIFNVSRCQYIMASLTVTLEIQHLCMQHKRSLNVSHLFHQQIGMKAKEHHVMDSSIFIFFTITLKQRYTYTVTAL